MATDLELWNIESIPKSAAEAPERAEFIFAFVCTMGASSLRGLWEVAYAAQPLDKEEWHVCCNRLTALGVAD